MLVIGKWFMQLLSAYCCTMQTKNSKVPLKKAGNNYEQSKIRQVYVYILAFEGSVPSGGWDCIPLLYD